jgi:hypothetical protein
MIDNKRVHIYPFVINKYKEITMQSVKKYKDLRKKLKEIKNRKTEREIKLYNKCAFYLLLFISNIKI